MLGRGRARACLRRCCSSRAASSQPAGFGAASDHDAGDDHAPRRCPTWRRPPADFVNINTMTRVGDHFVGSLNGHLAAALAVARSAKGGVYPVGTVLQLVPTEAMVKRHKGYSPATARLGVLLARSLAEGTMIASSGDAREELPRRSTARRATRRRRALRLRVRQESRLRAAPAHRRGDRDDPTQRPAPEASNGSGVDRPRAPTRSRPCRRACAGSRATTCSARGTL